MIDFAVTLLPEPEFADDAQRLAGVQREADAIDRTHDAGVGEEPGVQVCDLQDRLSGVGHADRASRGCRRPRS